MKDRLFAAADAVAEFPDRHPMGWPAIMTAVGFGALAASLLFSPGSDEWTYFFGLKFGGGCGFLEATGLPCPSCGMTRSWVHFGRGHVVQALQYNAAGVLMLVGLVWMGIVGAVRLITRDPTRLRHPVPLIGGLMVTWLIGPYVLLWLIRLAGYYPLAHPH